MRTFLKIVAALIVLGALGFAAVMVMTSGERDIARSFLMEATGGDYSAARARLHASLQEQFPLSRMQETFGSMAPYTEVSFSSVEAGGGSTSMSGTASTEAGCSSKVSFEVVGDRITSFEVTPPCPK